MAEMIEIPGYPGYAASKDGVIWSRKISGSGRNGRFWRELSPKDNKGYKYVTLYLNGVPRSWAVHQLILLTFFGPMPDGQEVRHLNDTPADNRLENLEYGTRKQNAEDAVGRGRSNKGEKHPRCKLSEADAREIIRLVAEEGVRAVHLVERFGVTAGAISMLLNGKSWSHLPRPESWAPRQKEVRTQAAKITEKQVLEIVQKYHEGWSGSDLSREYDVSTTAISHIITGHSWSHITGIGLQQAAEPSGG